MSTFAVTSSHYQRAAEILYRRREIDWCGMMSILRATHLEPTVIAYEAWKLFRDLFIKKSRIQICFESRGHCVTALCLMAAICEDEENEEEGQL